MNSADRIVPLKFAVPAVGLILAGVGFGFVTSLATARTEKIAKKAPAALVAGQKFAAR